MADIVNMPRLSDTMEEGTVATWLKKVGDTVAEGDILAEIAGRHRINSQQQAFVTTPISRFEQYDLIGLFDWDTAKKCCETQCVGRTNRQSLDGWIRCGW